jgi:hypothetical protein
LGSANPLIDRKLLDILHEEGIRKSLYDGGSQLSTENPGRHDEISRSTGSWHNLHHIIPEITCCNVADCGYFRASRDDHMAIQEPKWSFPEYEVWFSIDTLSDLPPKGAIGG